MTATSNFFDWYYLGLSLVGGWFVFFMVAILSVIWLYFYSGQKGLNAASWRLGIVLSTALLLPSLMWRLWPTDLALIANMENIFYLGILGGVVTPAIATAFYLNNKDSIAITPPQSWPREEIFSGDRQAIESFNPRPRKPKVEAWLLGKDGGGTHQLNAGTTEIGRSAKNDIRVVSDGTVSGRHAKIEERNGHFTFSDFGANGSKINGRRVTRKELLQNGDEIQLGKNTYFRFKM